MKISVNFCELLVKFHQHLAKVAKSNYAKCTIELRKKKGFENAKGERCGDNHVENESLLSKIGVDVAENELIFGRTP